MRELTFAHPIWIWGALVLLPLLALRIRSRLHTARSLPGLVSPRLHGRLVSGNSQAVKWVVFSLHAAALIGILVALARPQLGFDEIETETESRSLIVAIDTSRSMLATDLPPDRLSRAKLAAIDIVRSLPEDRIGLIAFAGRPFLQAPLTNDHEAVIESIDQLDTEIIPRGGTNLTAAAQLALDTFAESEVDKSALVVFSDGEALEGGEEMEQLRNKSKEAGMSIITVGVGTAAGSIIPEIGETGRPVPGVFIKDENGQVVRSRLDPAELKELAANGGTYVHLGGQDSLTRTVERIKNTLTATRAEGGTRLRPIERFMWPLAFSVVCLVLAHLLPMLWPKPKRKSSLATYVSARKAAGWFLAFAVPFSANAADGLWTGHDAFEKKNYEDAIRAYEGALAENPSRKDSVRLELAIGAAAYREGDYERAARSYGQALARADGKLREHAHYNLGNTLFRKGESALQARNKPANPDEIQALSGPGEAVESTIAQWEGAIEHYESALALDKGNERAAHNIEIVRKRLEELKEQEQEQQEQEQQQEEQKDDQEEQEEEQEENEEKEDQESESDEEEQQEKQEENEEKEDGEQEQDEKEDSGESEQEKENEQEQESEGDQSDESEEKGENGQPEEEQQPQDQPQEPEQPEEPQDGELEANADQPQPPPPSMSQADLQQNPETGYSPSEARQLLDALADETEVRPILMPAGNEKYRNW